MSVILARLEQTPPTISMSKDAKVIELAVGRTPAGARGEQGIQGEQGVQGDKGDPFIYSDFTPQQLAALKGARGDKGDKGDTGARGLQGLKGDKGDVGPAVPITTTLGQSATQAVSQKLLTDTIGSIDAALTAINGV